VSNLALSETSTLYTGLKVFSSLPSYIKDRQLDANEFKQLIKIFLYCNTFYTLQEYFSYNKSKVLKKQTI